MDPTYLREIDVLIVYLEIRRRKSERFVRTQLLILRLADLIFPPALTRVKVVLVGLA